MWIIRNVSLNGDMNVLLRSAPITTFLTGWRNIWFLLAYSSDRFDFPHIYWGRGTEIFLSLYLLKLTSFTSLIRLGC